MKINLQELRATTKKAILHYGYSEEDAKIIEEVILYAQLRGTNQGVVKLIGPGIPKNPQEGQIETEKETKLSALLNGNNKHSMVVVTKAVDIAIQKATEHGIGIVGTHGIATSSGSIGFYAKKIAENGLIGIIFSGSPEVVAAEGSYERILGTNPLSIAIPTQKDPMVLDMATAAMPWFGLVEAKTAGRSIPEGIAYDAEGNLTTDPVKALGGALRTFDKGYKSFGLSVMVQILAGPLVGASFTGVGDTKNNWAGHLVLAIDPEILNGLDNLKKGVDQMINKIKSTKKLPGVNEIILPGEKGDARTKKILESGEIGIEDNLYKELQKVANS